MKKALWVEVLKSNGAPIRPGPLYFKFKNIKTKKIIMMVFSFILQALINWEIICGWIGNCGFCDLLDLTTVMRKCSKVMRLR